MVPIGRNRSSPRPTSHRTSLARVFASFLGIPLTSARCLTKSTAGISSGKIFRSGPYDTSDRNFAPSETGSRSRTRIDPFVGARNPNAIDINVVLPAPLAPTNPVTPWCTVKSTLSSARCCPNCIDKSLTVMSSILEILKEYGDCLRPRILQRHQGF